MLRRILSWFLVLTLLVMFASCAEKVPNGVIEHEIGNRYIVKMPEGKSVNNYFTLTGDITGEMGYVHVTNMGNMDKSESLGGVNYSSVEEGGWVAYGGDLFMYIPKAGSIEAVRTAATVMLLNQNNYMTLEEAKEYIPFLG